MPDLAARIEALRADENAGLDEIRSTAEELLDRLEAGIVRAAERVDGEWIVNVWVKAGILLAFRAGRVMEFAPAGPLHFSDKENLPPRRPPAGVRIVPGGSSARRGSFLGPNVVMMPPAYVNVGAYVGEGTMVDSHALVGSCAQIGSGVHLSAGAQIGGVLEPVGARPVIVEDEAFVGALAGAFEGVIVGRRAVLAAGVILTARTPVHDLVRGEILRGTAASPLVIPEGAVIVPGSRPASGEYARDLGLHLSAPMIVKYRDASTEASTALEAALR